MAEFKKPTNEAEFEANFEQLKPAMNQTQAYYESSRCLFCYDAPCVTACPTGIDIPLFIRQINGADALGAAKTIYDSNWLGNACGKICPTEELCEGACVYNHQDVEPLQIGRLQTFATQTAIARNEKLFELAKPNGKSIGIIGAGPAGIACACEARMQGFEVHIYEAKGKPSGLTVYGVAPYKITNEEALGEMEYLQTQFGYNVHYNAAIKSSDDLAKLEAEHDAIFIGVGLGKTRSAGIAGEDLKNCYGATEYIADLRMQHAEAKSGTNVIVLGGGNTAMDAASESARMGASNVILAYRNQKENMSAYEFEYDLAKGVGVKGWFNVQATEILGENGAVSGVRFARTEVVDGKLQNIAGSEFDEACDLVIRATGQEKQKSWLEQINGLELDGRGCIVVNEAFQATNPKYFAAGDAVNGGAEVVNAAFEGKVAANGIASWLGV